MHVKIIFAKGLVSVGDLRIWPVSNFSVGRNDNQMVSEAYLSLKTLRKYNYPEQDYKTKIISPEVEECAIKICT